MTHSSHWKVLSLLSLVGCGGAVQLAEPSSAALALTGTVDAGQPTAFSGIQIATPAGTSTAINPYPAIDVTQGYDGPVVGKPGTGMWGSTFRYGPETSQDQMFKIFNQQKFGSYYANLESVLTVPAGSTAHQVIGGLFTVDNFNGGNAIPLIAQSVAETSNSAQWGINTVHLDSPHWDGGLDNVRLQDEYDYFTSSPTTTVRGQLIDGDFQAAPAHAENLIGSFCTTFSTSAYRWNQCYASGNGSADVAFAVGDTAREQDAGLPSQQVSFLYTDTSGGAQRAVQLSAVPSDGGAGADFHLDSSYSGPANLVLSNGQVVASGFQVGGSHVPVVLGSGTASVDCGSNGGGQVSMATIPIPAGSLGATGSLDIDLMWSFPTAPSAVTALVSLSNYAGAGGTNYVNNTVNGVTLVRRRITIWNNGAADSQIGLPAISNSDTGTSTANPSTSQIDTTQPAFLNIHCASPGSATARINYTVTERAP